MSAPVESSESCRPRRPPAAVSASAPCAVARSSSNAASATPGSLADVSVTRLELAVGGLLAGALLAATTFAAPSAAPTPASSGLAPWHPTPPSRFAAALEHLGHTPRRWWSERGTVNVLLHAASRATLPQIRVASAVAATTAQHSCRCAIRRYRVVTDRYGPDTITVAFGRPL